MLLQIHIAREFCQDLQEPIHGIQTCEHWGPNLKYRACSIQCEDGYEFRQKIIVMHFNLFVVKSQQSSTHVVPMEFGVHAMMNNQLVSNIRNVRSKFFTQLFKIFITENLLLNVLSIFGSIIQQFLFATKPAGLFYPIVFFNEFINSITNGNCVHRKQTTMHVRMPK